MRVRRAGFETSKHLEDFDFAFNPQVPKARIVDLATCRFVEAREAVLLIGPAGVGKSHQMLVQLRAARADKSHDKKLLRFTAPDLLIVDDLGLRPLDGDEPIDLYEVIRQRYERGAMIVTSNRALEEWHPLFLDDLLASAAMDRLLRHAHVVVMQGHSYRNPPEGRRQSA
jgi:DNA replication protein DnaC